MNHEYKNIFSFRNSLSVAQGCTDTLDELTGTREKRRESAAFPLKEARTFFEEFMEQIPVTRSSKELESDGVSFPTGEFIPLWQQARQCEWGGIVFFDVPIEAQMDYRARRRVDYEDDLWLYQDVPVYQCLMVMRNVENQRDACYIVTFIPDSNTTSMADCERYMRDENYGYYSGVVLFIDFYTQRPLRVNRYKDGKLQGGVFLAGPLEEAVSRVRYAQQLVGELQIAQRRRIMTTRLATDEIFGQFKGGKLVKNIDGTWTFYYDGIYYTLEDTDDDGYPDAVLLDYVFVDGHRPDHSSPPPYGGYIPLPPDTLQSTHPNDPPEDPTPGDEGGGGYVSPPSSNPSPQRLPYVKIPLAEKDYPGYIREKRDCLQVCKGILTTLLGNWSEVTRYQVYQNQNGTLKRVGDPQKGFDMINRSLTQKMPVIVGVDYKDGSPNSDNTTDHFLLIMGRGYDEGRQEYYYTYIESGRKKSQAAEALSDKNRIYYNEKEGTFTGQKRMKTSDIYKIVQIRPIKKN